MHINDATCNVYHGLSDIDTPRATSWDAILHNERGLRVHVIDVAVNSCLAIHRGGELRTRGV
jgi:hypothetical protein